jgi:hypothetical protein
MRGYNTNLASEFHVLGTLYRLGHDANLTLGNKKSVDITVVRGPADVITIDVKAVAKQMDWPVGSREVAHPERHFLVLLCYNGAFTDPATPPDVWVVPYADLEAEGLVKPYKGGMRVVSRARLLQTGDTYRNGWKRLEAAPPVEKKRPARARG